MSDQEARSAADTRPEGFKPDGTYEGTGWGIDHDRSHDLVRNPWPVESAASPLQHARRAVPYGAQLAHAELDWAERALAALAYIKAHPNGVGDHHPSAVATAALEGRAIPRV